MTVNRILEGAPRDATPIAVLDRPRHADGVVLSVDRPLERPGLLYATRGQLAAKRLFDVVGATVLLVLFAPLLVAAALAVRLTSPGPALFVQERVGFAGRRFRMLKFRSMYRDAEARRLELDDDNECDGPVFKMRDDPRITPVGRLLRRASLDELPQLLNVLRGDMSLVGPRPPLPAEVATYDRRQRQRLLATPGLTCLWQVSGRSDLDFDTWIDLDLRYIRSWTFATDLRLLARTLPAVLTGRGAY